MLKFRKDIEIYLFTSPTDMRRSFDRLAEMVREFIKVNPLSGGVFVFCSRRRDKVKILYWEEDGFALWYKRLEEGTFKIKDEDGYENITVVDLKLLLQGMDLSRIKFRKKSKEDIFTKSTLCY